MGPASKKSSGIERAAPWLCLALAACAGPSSSDPTSAAGSFIQVTIGSAHSCGLKSDGSVWCWGANALGTLGNGRLEPSSRPVSVLGPDGRPLGNARSIRAGGSHTCARREGGTAVCWGDNGNGQLGDGTNMGRDRAVEVKASGGNTLQGVVDLALGEGHSCARLDDGGVRCWGDGFYGQLGHGETKGSRFPVAVQLSRERPLTGVVELSVGRQSSCARTQDGTLWCWGDNARGQLGDGTFIDRLFPAQVRAGDGVAMRAVELSVGSEAACARKADGTVWCWGANRSGVLGSGAVGEDQATASPGFDSAMSSAAGDPERNP